MEFFRICLAVLVVWGFLRFAGYVFMYTMRSLVRWAYVRNPELQDKYRRKIEAEALEMGASPAIAEAFAAKTLKDLLDNKWN